MTTPTEATREALPEPLKVVAWLSISAGPSPDARDRMLSFQATSQRGWTPHALVRLTDAQSALESERQAHAAEVERLRGDAARMDWLMEHTVNVRVHMRYGSRNLFWAGPQEGDGEILPSDLRTRIDQAIARGKT